MKKFRRGPAPGPSGLRLEHVKAALKAPPNRSDKALAGLTKLVNGMRAGKVPATVATYLCGACLHAAMKKDRGLRPIAVGNLARRITAKCAASRVTDKAMVHLSPLQLGVTVRGGCEAIAHAVRETLERDPDKLLLQAEFINAFNTMDRATVLDEVARFSPELLPWVSTCYGAPSHLQYGASLIPSATGLQQGDALASFLFSLALHPIIKKVEQEVPNLALHAWFLDDGTAIGTKEELQSVVDIVTREGACQGLLLSTAASTEAPSQPKSTIWSPIRQGLDEEADPLRRGVPRVTEPGVTLLGAPIGNMEFVKSELKAKVEKIRRIVELLHSIQDPHTKFVLLRSCLSLPKLSFILRTTDTSPFKSLTGWCEVLWAISCQDSWGQPSQTFSGSRPASQCQWGEWG